MHERSRQQRGDMFTVGKRYLMAHSRKGYLEGTVTAETETSVTVRIAVIAQSYYFCFHGLRVGEEITLGKRMLSNIKELS